MNNFIKYLRVQFLRALKLYPAIIIFTLILALAVTTLLGGLFDEQDSAEDKTKIQIGLVGDLSDSYLGVGISAVQNFDSSKYYIEFTEMDRPTAVERLEKGELMGFVEIPDGFVESIVSGENANLKYVSSSRPAVLGSLLIEEIVDVVSKVIVDAQNGIYGYINYVNKTDLSPLEKGQLINRVNLEYINLVLDREGSYELEYLGVGDSLPYKEYYVCAFLLIMLMLMGTVCVNLSVKTDLSLDRSLISAGHKTPLIILAEYLPFFGITATNLLLFMLVVGSEFSGSERPTALFGTLNTVGDFAVLAVSLLPVVAVIAAMQFMLYELTSNLISGLLLQIVSCLALSFASGFLLPLASMPDTVQSVAAFLPTRLAFLYTAEVANDSFNPSTLLYLAIYFVIFFSVSIAVRNIKVRSSKI